VPRRHISKIRSKSAFRRRPGQREPRSITLIVCEGETEQGYFEAARIHFQLTTAEVVVADNTKGAAPISVVECAEERAAEYETVSVPCFELWVLLHFERTDRPFQRCADVIAQIRREHLNSYAKADDGVTKQLMLRVETALANARWLNGRTGIEGENPSTSVNAAMQHMKDVGSRPTPG
jgi:hypothetical protein